MLQVVLHNENRNIAVAENDDCGEESDDTSLFDDIDDEDIQPRSTLPLPVLNPPHIPFPDHQFLMKNFKLRRIVKENHGGPIINAASCPLAPNIFASIGLLHSTGIYDNTSGGDHLDLVSHLNSKEKEVAEVEEAGGSNLCGLCWLSFDAAAATPGPQDSLLAIAERSGTIRVLSIAWSRELHRWSVGGSITLDILSSIHHRDIIFSLPRLGSVEVWYWPKQSCIARLTIPSRLDGSSDEELRINTCFAINSTGSRLIVATTLNEFFEFDISLVSDLAATLIYSSSNAALFSASVLPALRQFNTIHLNPSAIPVDCVSYALNDTTIVSKSTNGAILHWNLNEDPQNNTPSSSSSFSSTPSTTKIIKLTTFLHSFSVKQDINYTSRFDISPTSDGRYLCVGNTSGAGTIFDLMTGEKVVELKHRRVTRSVRCCRFMPDMK